MAILPRIPPDFPSDVSIPRVSIIPEAVLLKLYRYGTVNGFVGQTTGGEGGFPMLQEEIQGKIEFVLKKNTKKSFDSGVDG